MKKNALFGLMSAAMLLATSCTNEIEGIKAGLPATVSFQVATPDISTRVYSDGKTATNLQYAVYDEDGTYLPKFTVTDADIDITATVNLQLTTGNTYSVIFWASAEEEKTPYTLDFATQTMTVDYADVVSNNENYDAFYACYTFTVVEKEQVEDVELKRPFAQLNIGTSDYAASAEAGYVPTKSYVKVPVFNTLNLATGAVTNQVYAEFDFAAINRTETFPLAGYEYLAMNYLLIPVDKQTVEVEFQYADDANNTKTEKVGSVPVQRNYRTNLYGNILTSEVKLNIEIKPGFNEPAHEKDLNE